MLTRFLTFFVLALNVVNLFADQKDVTYGSAVVLRHINTKYKLSSGAMSWGYGSKEQIVTAVPGNDSDDNLMWIVKPLHSEGQQRKQTILNSIADGGKFDNLSKAAGSRVKCGDVVRFEHVGTGKNLHSHDQAAGISSNNYEVCGFGQKGMGNDGDDFKVECAKGETVWHLESPVSLQHVASKGLLVTSKHTKFTDSNCPRCPIVGHQEVTVQRSSIPRDKSDLWTAELGLLLDRDEEDDEQQKKDEL